MLIVKKYADSPLYAGWMAGIESLVWVYSLSISTQLDAYR